MMVLSDYLLGLYGATGELPANEFAEFAFAHTKRILKFDSARYMSVDTKAASATAVCATLHNEPDSLLLDWERISRQDSVLQEVTRQPGKAYNFNARHLYAGAAQSIMRDYATRYAHENGVVVAARNAHTGYWDGLSLYRARHAQQFNRDEAALLEELAPHWRLALHLNQTRGHELAKGDIALAIIQSDGALRFCTPRFVKLVQALVPDWHGPRLPEPVLQTLKKNSVCSFHGTRIRLAVRRVDQLLMVRALQASRVTCLSNRELLAARLYCQGGSHKEVAQQMTLAPATVRNMVQRIYAKLGVRDKGELATLFAREAA
ncbi:MAG: LuxR C-terminal-related transcriptional regulator [Pseudomonadota bacterium]